MNRLARLTEHPLTAHLTRFVQGPVRNNLKVSKHLFRLILTEQKIVPELATWPVARHSYVSFVQSVVGTVRNGRTYDTLSAALSNVTWGHVITAGRVGVELVAFYYIGNLVGKSAAYPLRLFKDK